jgi:hypothetical protein
MIGAAKLESATYEEVEADTHATGQALGVVVLSALAAGIGALGAGERGLLVGIVAALIGWYLWALLTWVIGTKFLPEPQTQADLGQLLRTIGFGASPGLIRIFAWVPLLGWAVQGAAWVWMLAATVVAVRQALDYTSTGRAILVCLIGWFVNLLVMIWTFAFLGIAVWGMRGLSGS